jgi:hypothetical protein
LLPTLRRERELKLFRDMISFLGRESHVSQKRRRGATHAGWRNL